MEFSAAPAFEAIDVQEARDAVHNRGYHDMKVIGHEAVHMGSAPGLCLLLEEA
jgi:hypothetical protein